MSSSPYDEPESPHATWENVLYTMLTYIRIGEPVIFPDNFGLFAQEYFEEVSIREKIINLVTTLKLSVMRIFDSKNKVIVDRFNTILDLLADNEKCTDYVELANNNYIDFKYQNSSKNFNVRGKTMIKGEMIDFSINNFQTIKEELNESEECAYI